MLYVLYKIEFCNKEKFQSTTSGYQADVEAIRNLSSIATQLTSNNTLTMPGALNITNELSVKTGDPGKQVKIGSSQIKFRGDGIVHYGLTNDKDGKFKISNLSGSADIGSGFVNDCITTDSIGNTTINGSLVVNGTIKSTRHLFYKRFTVSINSSYTIEHNLNIPIQLLTIRLFATDDVNGINGWHDITGQLLNLGYNFSYGIRVEDSNKFTLYTGAGCVAVGRNKDSSYFCPQYNATYDLYII
jgi:hypothetical protein